MPYGFVRAFPCIPWAMFLKAFGPRNTRNDKEEWQKKQGRYFGLRRKDARAGDKLFCFFRAFPCVPFGVDTVTWKINRITRNNRNNDRGGLLFS